MNHIQITIQANDNQQEILISKLDEVNAVGFEQTPTHLLAYFEEEHFESLVVTKLLMGYEFHQTQIPQRNWNQVWESNFEPVVVDDFCAIRADFHSPIKGVQYDIIITPKMSFGTGHHQTTYLMMEEMRTINFKKKKVFDFGTGTGILAILASKLGAAAVTAIDIDEWSINNAEENFEKNNIGSVRLYQSSIVPSENFDVILANINRNVLVEHASSLVNILADKGQLLISGLLSTDEKIIVEAYNMLQLKNVQHKDKWMSLLLSR